MDALINIGLLAILIAALIWTVTAPALVALIPTFIFIATGIALVSRNTDYIKSF